MSWSIDPCSGSTSSGFWTRSAGTDSETFHVTNQIKCPTFLNIKLWVWVRLNNFFLLKIFMTSLVAWKKKIDYSRRHCFIMSWICMAEYACTIALFVLARQHASQNRPERLSDSFLRASSSTDVTGDIERFFRVATFWHAKIQACRKWNTNTVGSV